MRKKRDPGASTWIDPDDAPELTDDHFVAADIYEGECLVRRGRPPAEETKQPISLRVDRDVLEHYRATGPGWQRRMNDALRKAAGL